MIIYSRFNCRQFCLERSQTTIGKRRATRKMDRARFNEEWLRERVRLFNNYTLPSVLSQTDQQFRWIGIAHPDSPDWFLDEIASNPKMELKLSEWDVDSRDLDPHTSTNLDTDDAISRDYVAEVKKVKFEGETIFARGLRYRELTGRWTKTRSDRTHFNIVKHSNLTVLDFCHGAGPLPRQILDHKRPMWLEVVHENNIMNKINVMSKDKKLPADYHKEWFELNDKIFTWRG